MTPSFRFLRRVDGILQRDPDRAGNLFSVGLVVTQGGAALMDVPIVMAEFLKEAGFQVTEEECWAVVGAVSSGTATEQQRADYTAFALALTEALVPEVGQGKNAEAPAAA